MWEEYEVLRRKYELGSEYGSVCSWKEKVKMRNEDWVEEVSSLSTLKWYNLAKNGAWGGEVFEVCSVSGSCETVVQIADWLSWVGG